MINALKKLIQGDTAFTATELGSGTVGTAEIAASAVVAAKVAASAIAITALKYTKTTYSLAGDAVGTASAMSVTYSATITSGAVIVGAYLTKQTSHANTPILTNAGNGALLVSLAQALVGSDLVEGVVITIAP